jgi:WD40 repeat protein
MSNLAQLAPIPRIQFLDDNGVPLALGNVYTYQAGTATPLAAYIDALGVTPATNPIVLDTVGCATIWLKSNAYKFVIKDVNNVVIRSIDNIQLINDGFITTTMLADNSITTAKIQDQAVTSAKIEDGAVGATELADNSVTTSKIVDGAVTTPKLSGTGGLALVETSDPRFGEGPSAFPNAGWTGANNLLANPASTPLGAGNAIAFSPNGKILAIGENSGAAVELFQRLGSLLKKMSPAVAIPSAQSAGNASAVAWSPGGEYLAVGQNSSSAVWLYQKNGNSFADLAAITGSGDMRGLAWSPDGDYLALAHDSSPYVKIFKRGDVATTLIAAYYQETAGQSISNSGSVAIDYDTLVSDNMSAVTTGSGWAFTAPRTNWYDVTSYISLASASWTANDSVKLTLFKNGGALEDFARWKAPSTSTINPGPSFCGSIPVFLQANDQITVKMTQTRSGSISLDTTNCWIKIVERAGFNQLSSWTQLSNPGTLPTGAGKAVAWTPDSQYLAVGHATSPYITVYQRTGDTFAKLSNPASLPAGQVNGVAWSPDGQFLACALNVSPYIAFFRRSGSTLTKLSDPSTLPTGQANGVAFSPVGGIVAMAHAGATNYAQAYSYTANGNSTVFTNVNFIANVPGSATSSVSWTPDGKYLAFAQSGSPYMTVLVAATSIGTNAILYTKEVDLV